LLPALKVPSGLRYINVSHSTSFKGSDTYTFLLSLVLADLVLVSDVPALGSELLGQL
jgi:hypothetical protein